MTRSSATLMLLAAAFFWGSGNVANKTVLDHVGPLTAVAFRCLIAAVVVIPWALPELQAKRATGAMASMAGVSLFFCTAMALQQTAFQTATVTNASFLVNTCSILTPIIAWAVLRERAHPRITCAAAATLAGAFFMTGATFSVALMNRGDILCLVSAIFYAAWMVALGRHLSIHGRPFTMCFTQFAISSGVLLPISAQVEVLTLSSLAQATPQLLGLGLFSTGFAFVLQARAQQAVSSSTAAIIVSAESLFGAAGAYLWLGEHTAPLAMAGAVLILSGIVIASIAAKEEQPISVQQPRWLPNHQTAPEQHPKTPHH